MAVWVTETKRNKILVPLAEILLDLLGNPGVSLLDGVAVTSTMEFQVTEKGVVRCHT